MKRSDLPDNIFGIPEERKYPMPDKKHTLSAIKLFGHVEDKYEKELANNIIKNMKKFNISNDIVGENNKLKKYLKEGYQEEDTFIVQEEGERKLITKITLEIHKYNIQHKTPINNISDLIKYHKNPGLENYISKCNDYDAAFYIKSDISDDINKLKEIKEKIIECKKGENTKNKEYYKNIKKKYLDKDLSEKDVDLTLTWADSIYKKISKKVKDLESKESSKYFDESILIDNDENEYIEEGALNKITMSIPVKKYNKSKGVTINNTADLIYYHKNPGIEHLVEITSNADDLSYIRKDTRTIIGTLKKIRERIPLCKNGETPKNKNYYKGIKKMYLDRGLKEKDVDLTLTWVDDICKKITQKIKSLNESVGAGPVVGINSPNNNEPIYIVNYMQNNVFSGSHQERFGICKSGMKDLHIVGGNDNRLHYTDLDEFEKEAEDIKVYKYTGNMNKSFYSIIEDAENDLDFYTMLTGQSITNRSDIEKNADFVRESYIRDELSAIQECIYATAMADTINESYIKNEPDIYYNKDKFDNGEINLCFITGLSGSGKSTMGGKMEKDNKAVTHYQIDDVMANYNFSDNNLKEYGNLIYSYFNGPGKKYRFKSVEEFDKNLEKYKECKDFFTPFIQSFIDYSMKYADSHKDERIIIDGIQIYFYKQLSKLEKYAVYIKGTSAAISAIRSAKRDSKISNSKVKNALEFLSTVGSIGRIKYFIADEKELSKFRKYFSNLVKQSSNESAIIDESSSIIPYEIPLLGINEDGRSYNYYRDLDGVYAKNELTGLRCKSYDSIEDILESVLNLVKNGFY